MTSKREDREALIEEAAKAIFAEIYPDEFVPDVFHPQVAEMKAARAALAVFEQAHTPTDDEREILTRIIHDETGEPEEESGFVADAILAAGFRRPVQGEPPVAPYFDDGMIDPDICRECEEPESSCRCLEARTPEPQGEPTDAQVLAALSALLPAVDWSAEAMGKANPTWIASMRDALRAAAAVQNTVTIPEHLSKRDELGPAIRKVLVDDARAENDKRRGEDARRLRAAVIEQGGENR